MKDESKSIQGRLGESITKDLNVLLKVHNENKKAANLNHLLKSQIQSKQKPKPSCCHTPLFNFTLLTFAFPIFQRKYLIGGVCTGLLPLSPSQSPSVTCSKSHFPLFTRDVSVLPGRVLWNGIAFVVDNLGPLRQSDQSQPELLLEERNEVAQLRPIESVFVGPTIPERPHTEVSVTRTRSGAVG